MRREHEILTSIDEAKKQFKHHLETCLNPENEPFRTLTFAWGFNILKVQIKFALMDSPIGFPYTRVTAYMQLNGKKITRAQLKEVLPPVLPPIPTSNE